LHIDARIAPLNLFPAMEFLRLVPIFQARVWGGDALRATLGRSLPGGEPIGESWEVVDRPEADSVIAEGAHAGRTLGQLRRAQPEALLGPHWPADRPFPILVKWLDCRERLSLQVHPPAAIAPALGGEPKTEVWYLAATAPGAALLAGLRPGVSREQFESSLAKQDLEPLIHRFTVAPGDSLFVPSGRIHAIDAGCLILEIQQNSDTTYRVYDWGRVGLDGKPRALHVAESIASIDWDDVAPEPLRDAGGERVLADAPEFHLRQVELAEGQHLEFAARSGARILSVVSGGLSAGDGRVVERGDNIVLPYAGHHRFTATAATRLLVTERFA